jgi:uncharacterized protein DUF3363
MKRNLRQTRGLIIGRVKHLERYGLANEVERGWWGVSGRAEGSLTELSERNDVIKTVIRRALAKWANVWVKNYECSNIAVFWIIWRKGCPVNTIENTLV